MGMGEPLNNYDNLIERSSIMSNPNGLKILRERSVSTSGVTPKINKLAEAGPQSPARAVPSCGHSVEESQDHAGGGDFWLVATDGGGALFRRKTGQRVTFEYIFSMVSI